MATEVILPKVDMVMETGTFLEWLKQEGESVKKGEPLFVISTDKAAMEIESPATGILSGLNAKRDDVIPVTTTLAYILEPGELSLPAAKPLRDSAADTSPVPNAPPPIPSPIPGEGERGFPRSPEGRGARAEGRAEVAGPSTALRSAQDGHPERSDTLSVERNRKARATPVARRMAAELGLDLASLTGRGPGGRVHKLDVLEAAARQTTKPESGMSGSGPAAPPLATPNVPLPDARRKQVIPLAGPRKIIAERMAYSASVAPHITLSLNVDMSEATRMRSRIQTQLDKTGYRLSFTAIIARAVAAALTRHPFMNASLAGDSIILWQDVHLGIATSLEDYLIVPVIRQAQDKNLEQIVTALGDMLERARARRLTPAEITGSTFTISNLGMFGIESFTAIINPPESAILAVGKIVDQPLAVGEVPQVRPMMNLTVSADHRVVDGVAAARFLDDLKTTLENPYLLI